MVHEMNHHPTVVTTTTEHGFLTPNATFTEVDGAYMVITYVATIVSVLGNLMVIGCYYLYPDIRTAGRKLFGALCIADAVYCIAILLEVGTFYKSTESKVADRSVLCETAALFNVYGSTSVSLWVVAINFYLFLCVSLRLIVVANRVTWLFHSFAWIMPAVIACSAGASDVYGYDDLFLRSHHRPAPCWISDRITNKLDWKLVTVEGWAIASYCACVFMYVVISCSVKCQRVQKIDRDYVIEDLAIVTANQQLRYVSITFTFLRVWGTLYFMCMEYGSKGVQEALGDVLLICKGVGDASIGWVNCLFFVFSIKPLRRRIYAWIRNRCKGRVHVPDKWRPSRIVRKMKTRSNSSLDMSGLSLNLGDNESNSSIVEDDIIFDRSETRC